MALAQNPINIDEYKVIDQSRFIITYEAMMTDDSLKPTEHNYDRLVLMVGDSISRCYSNTMYRYDSAFTISERKGHDGYKNMSHFVGDSGGVWVPDVYKYYGSKRMTIMHRIDEALADLIEQATSNEGQISEYVGKLLNNMDYDVPYTASNLMDKIGIKTRDSFRNNYLRPAMDIGLVEMTIPDKPNSKNQRYIKK